MSISKCDFIIIKVIGGSAVRGGWVYVCVCMHYTCNMCAFALYMCVVLYMCVNEYIVCLCTCSLSQDTVDITVQPEVLALIF